MRILSLRLCQFRNHLATELPADAAPLCLLHGPNGAGKTSVLEAIHLLATGVGIRSKRDQDFVTFEHDGYRLDAALDTPFTCALRVRVGEEKEAYIDGRRLARWSELIGHVRATLLRPEDIRLIEEGPEYRRRFLDIMLCQSKSSYLATLRQFRRAYRQRLQIFGDRALSRSFSRLMLDEMPRIFAARAAAVERLNRLAATLLESLRVPGRLELVYQPALPRGASPADWNEAAAACLRETERLEEAGANCPFGPLRDEVSITLDGVSLRRHGSQGQKRLISLVLRLAEAEYLAEQGSEPILLVDDVFGELDHERFEAFLQLISSKDRQVWVATTNAEPFEECWPHRTIFDIKRGILQGVERQ